MGNHVFDSDNSGKGLLDEGITHWRFGKRRTVIASVSCIHVSIHFIEFSLSYNRFKGGCLFDHVTCDMEVYKEEVFGPVLSVLRATNFEEALSFASRHQYGNGVAIFTRSGHVAREFTRRVDTGMVGVNVPIPVPVAFYSFGGWKRSAYGGFNQYGPEGIRFFTKKKHVVSRWPENEQGTDFTLATVK